MNTVQTNMKDRCATMRRTDTPDEYEFGWLVVNRRDRSKDQFSRAGTGTREEAQEWLSNPGVRRRRAEAKELARRG